MTLSVPASQPSQRRPHQNGYATGSKHGFPVQEPVEWLVDTGADIGYVNGTIGSRFDSTTVHGVSAHPLAGAATTVVTGIDVELEVTDPTTGAVWLQQTTTGARYVAISSRAAGINLVGMNQLADLGVTLRWCAQTRSGALEV